MTALSPAQRVHEQAVANDEHLFGWDPTQGIVSVWANRIGVAFVWQRINGAITCTATHFRPWMLATRLDDLAHLSAAAEQSFEATTAPVIYRELDGPPSAYRYLLSARPGFALEAALLKGASRRLGRTINSTYDLDDTYYQVGPVEQYLMMTGRVYFRGLTYPDLHRLQFDLETTALDPQQGRIFLVAARDNHGLSLTLEAPTPDDERQLIIDLCALIAERDPDVIENHNLFGFDLPFLEQRASILGVPLRLGRETSPHDNGLFKPPLVEHYPDPHRRPSSRRRMRLSVPGRELIDTLDAVRRYDFAARDLPNHRLKDVARHFGIAGAEREYIAGSEVFDTFRTDPERVRRYAMDDVAEVDGLSQRLLGAPFVLAGMAPRRYERLASAGPAMGILEPMLVRSYVRAGAALPCQPEWDKNTPDPHAGGALHLYATGIAEHVVKADVASLYPSIMRTYHIGSSADPLNVLLSLVDRLTDLRLKHKGAARAATPGSLEHGRHMGYQAAMKTLINSAYGYLGAGSMALFADRYAAGEVTRRGREVLGMVVDALRARGMALVEADTDGVYFAVPPAWSEANERALVAEIAHCLPQGINLEFEGRYRAMLSHEVKNYALLTYDGELIVRGVALRSSKVEPYGERFLHEALHCALVGNVEGVRTAFLNTINALRNRTLTARDVAMSVRLAKTPEAYMTTRAAHREQQYEALLAANRTSWSPGERVRVYRAQGGASVWLPEETDESETSDQATSRDAARAIASRYDYDVEHYLQVLVTSYASRLRKAFAPHDWARLFRLDTQLGLFDQPINELEPLWIRCEAVSDEQS